MVFCMFLGYHCRKAAFFTSPGGSPYLSARQQEDRRSKTSDLACLSRAFAGDLRVGKNLVASRFLGLSHIYIYIHTYIYIYIQVTTPLTKLLSEMILVVKLQFCRLDTTHVRWGY